MEPLDHLRDTAQKIRLTDAERLHIRSKLISYMDAHPVHVQSPFMQFVAAPWVRGSAYAFSLLLLVGGSTAYAARDSLPGAPLYAVKVDIVEPTIGLFQVSDGAQANWQVELAERRLIEADVVSNEPTAPLEAKAEAAAQVADSATKAAEKIDQFASRDEDNAADLAATFDTTIEAHGTTIAALSASTTPAAPVLQALSDESNYKHQPLKANKPKVVETVAVTVASSAPATHSSVISATLVVTTQVATSTDTNTRVIVATTSVVSSATTSHEKIKNQKSDEQTYREARTLFARTHALAEKSKQQHSDNAKKSDDTKVEGSGK